MKRIFTLILSGGLMLWSLAAIPLRADDLSFQVFYDGLSTQGQWIQTDSYGYCWQPPIEDSDWRPYAAGHWVLTEVGWTWVSDEPWGWATYHYGRWVNLDGTGWVWVPGHRWAPAWVSWRYGGGYAGWAPLPPESFAGIDYSSNGGVQVNTDFAIGSDVDVSLHIGAGCYNFIPATYLGESNYRHYYVNRYQNYTVINRTTNITNIRNNYRNENPGSSANAAVTGGWNHGIRAGGPPVDSINLVVHTPMRRVQLVAAGQRTEGGLQGGRLALYAPTINPQTKANLRPPLVARSLHSTHVNHGDDVTRPLAVTAAMRPEPPTPQVIHLAQTAQENAPSAAHIARPNTPIHQTWTQPHIPEHTSNGPGNPPANQPAVIHSAVHPSVPTSSTYLAPPKTTYTSPKMTPQPTTAKAPPFSHTPVTGVPAAKPPIRPPGIAASSGNQGPQYRPHPAASPHPGVSQGGNASGKPSHHKEGNNPNGK